MKEKNDGKEAQLPDKAKDISSQLQSESQDLNEKDEKGESLSSDREKGISVDSSEEGPKERSKKRRKGWFILLALVLGGIAIQLSIVGVFRPWKLFASQDPLGQRIDIKLVTGDRPTGDTIHLKLLNTYDSELYPCGLVGIDKDSTPVLLITRTQVDTSKIPPDSSRSFWLSCDQLDNITKLRFHFDGLGKKKNLYYIRYIEEFKNKFCHK